MYTRMLKYRLGRYSPHGKGRFWIGTDTAYLDKVVAAAPEAFYSSYEKSEGHCLRWDSPLFKPDLRALSLELRQDALAHGRSANSAKDTDLIAAVMAKGDVFGSYGATYWGDDSDTFHLLVCGIDWNRFNGVESATWSTFNDTYSPNRESDVLGASFYCRCKDSWREVRFGLPLPSLAKMFIALSSNALEEVFDV